MQNATMSSFDLGAPYRENIQKVWDLIGRLPDGDIPIWSDERIIEIDNAWRKLINTTNGLRAEHIDDLFEEVEAWEKSENFETVRSAEGIDRMLAEINSLLGKLLDSLPLDEQENTNKRHKEIIRLSQGINCLMIKAELLRRKEYSEQLVPFIHKRGSRRNDNRIIWISKKRTPVEFLKKLSSVIAIPDYLSIETVSRAHFFIPSTPTPLPPGHPTRLRWLEDISVLAFLFEELADWRFIWKRQQKRIATHFVDKNGLEINPESFVTLVYKRNSIMSPDIRTVKERK